MTPEEEAVPESELPEDDYEDDFEPDAYVGGCVGFVDFTEDQLWEA